MFLEYSKYKTIIIFILNIVLVTLHGCFLTPQTPHSLPNLPPQIIHTVAMIKLTKDN